MKIRDGVAYLWSLPDQSDVPVTHFTRTWCPHCGSEGVFQRMRPDRNDTRLYNIRGRSAPLIASLHRCPDRRK